MNARYDVIVVGAGLIGSAFALLLAQRTQANIAVVERAPALRQNSEPNQRVVALGKAATDILDQTGILKQLNDAACHRYRKMFVWDENSDGQLEFQASDYDQQFLGHMIDSVECNLCLQSALANQSNLDVIYQFGPQHLCLDDGVAKISDPEQTLEGRLLVAADGARSWVRQQAKIFSHRESYHQLGIVARVRSEHSHEDTAWQRFLATGPLAILPLHDNQSSIVWSATQDTADELLALTDVEFEQALSEALEGKLGEMSLLSGRKAFPLQSQRSDAYFKQHLALIGDAAHSIHPLAGQGANLGFKDVRALVELLQKQPVTEWADLQMLERYQRARKADNEQTDWLMSALHGAYQSDLPWWRAARGKGMNWISNSRRLKAVLAKQAMGI